MTMNQEKKYTKSQVARRKKIEAELAAVPAVPIATRKLTSREGFADYYLEMQDLYPSQRLAYERLEDFHIDATGHRRYSEFNSFRKSLDRLLEQQKSLSGF